MSRAERYTAAHWIALGHKALAEGGADAVKLEAICKAAGLTRGSFYHHFKDHPAFLAALAAAWADRNTSRLMAGLGTDNGQPDADARTLNERAFDLDFALEVGMRDLARRHPAVAEIVAETDDRRLAVLRDLAQARFGLSSDKAADVAFLEYAAFCGMMLIRPGLDRATRDRLSRLLDDMTRRQAAQDWRPD